MPLFFATVAVGFFAPRPLAAFSSMNVNIAALPEMISSSSTRYVHGNLGWDQTQYLTADPDHPELNNSYLGSARFDAAYEDYVKADVEFGRETAYASSYFTIRELYGAFRPTPAVQVAIGGQRATWSDVDDQWALGLWQPVQNYDPLQPVTEGLLGIHAELNEPYVQIGAYWSPFFLPSSNPEFQNENGRFVSLSRWYSEPASSSPIMDHKTKLDYTFQSPDYASLLAQSGAGLRARIGAEDGLFLRASLGNKPLNALLVEYDAALVLSQGAESADVQIVPFVGREMILSSDAGFNSAHFQQGDGESYVISYLQDQPIVDLPTDQFVRQVPGALRVYSATGRLARQGGKISMDVSYLRAFQEESKDQDATGAVRSNFFPYRLSFYNAVQWTGSWRERIARHNTKFSLRILRDFEQLGGIVSLTTSVETVRNLWLALGADYISVDDDSVDNTDGRFLNQFRSNDRVFTRLTFVF